MVPPLNSSGVSFLFFARTAMSFTAWLISSSVFFSACLITGVTSPSSTAIATLRPTDLNFTMASPSQAALIAGTACAARITDFKTKSLKVYLLPPFFSAVAFSCARKSISGSASMSICR